MCPIFQSRRLHLSIKSSIMQLSRKFASLSNKLVSGKSKSLNDNHGRIHDYLRISLTERCNLRCRYCMPAEGIELTRASDCLSLPELKRLTNIFVRLCGVSKIRLTGGEPTIDRKLVPLLEHLNSLRDEGLKTMSLTTNGIALRKRCASYKQLGLDGLNISLDTLREDRFEAITRRKGLKHVLESVDEALDAKFNRVKLNCVVMRGVNDDELTDFASFARRRPIEVRFIEFMPFFGNRWSADRLVPFDEMLSKLMADFPRLKKVDQSPNETAKLFKEPDALGTIGFITSMTNNFCSGCNRIRITADGNLKVCLFGRAEVSLRDLIRNGATDDELVQTVRTALRAKKQQHAGLSVLQSDLSRPMIKIAVRSTHSAAADRTNKFTHLDESGKVKMVDVSSKRPLDRVAEARGEIHVGQTVLDLIKANLMAKGDIVTVAKIAGIMGAKQTSNLIPMCHQIPLDYVHVSIEPSESDGALRVVAKVKTEHKTGVEMECLTAVSVTLLTIYDMCKSVGSKMVIRNIELVSKTKREVKRM